MQIFSYVVSVEIQLTVNVAESYRLMAIRKYLNVIFAVKSIMIGSAIFAVIVDHM